MEAVVAYTSALIAVAGVALVTLLQSAHVNVVRTRHGLAPDATIPAEYGDPVFRVVRTFLNSTESLPAFAGAVLAAVLLGAPAFWVSLLALVHLLFRLGYWAIYVSGVGVPSGGARSMAYAGGWAANVAIAVLAIAGGLA
jgi:uncharacterized MAPEG superfamily protein